MVTECRLVEMDAVASKLRTDVLMSNPDDEDDERAGPGGGQQVQCAQQ